MIAVHAGPETLSPFLGLGFGDGGVEGDIDSVDRGRMCGWEEVGEGGLKGGEGEGGGWGDEEVEGWFVGWGVDGAEMRGEGGGFDEAAKVGEMGGCLCRRVMVVLVVSD